MKKFQKIKKIFNICSFVLFALVFILSIFVVISMVQASRFNKPAWIFGYQYSIVASPSMEPDLMTGDIIFVKKAELSSIDVNDWIVFYSESENKYIVHAVNRIEDGKYYTKGIANKTEDRGFVDESNFIGKVDFSLPFGQIGIYAVNNRATVMLFIMGFLVIIIGMNAFDIYKILVKKEEAAHAVDKAELEKQLREEIQKELAEEAENKQEE